MSQNSVASRLIAKMYRVRTGRMAAVSRELTAPLTSKATGIHPSLAHYAEAQSRLHEAAAHFTDMKEMAWLITRIAASEDKYVPEGPPMSPLTSSYFNAWVMFDAAFEKTGDTLCSIILELGAAAGIDSEVMRLARAMSESRMGFYRHQGVQDGLAVLEELVTGVVCQVLVPAGYVGTEGELWFARVLPPAFPGSKESLVSITPYIILNPAAEGWLAYFERTLPKPLDVASYEVLMKRGVSWDYWNEYIFLAYANHRQDRIALMGLPDMPESLPHSKVNQDRTVLADE